MNKRTLKRETKIINNLNKADATEGGLNGGEIKKKAELTSFYSDDWCSLLNFRVCDAAKPEEKYADSAGNDITHIYSYNKVMSVEDRGGICSILNRTNWRVLAWYFGPEDTRKTGLENFETLMRSPMQSTGGEKFSVYVYFRTAKYVPRTMPPSPSEADDVQVKALES